MVSRNLVAQLSQFGEANANSISIVRVRGDCHQSLNVQPFDPKHVTGKRFQIVWCDPELRRLTRRIDLQMNRHFLTRVSRVLADLSGESDAVDGLDRAEQIDGDLRLVPLQMADQMPVRVTRYRRHLRLPPLHPIFAKGISTGIDRGLNDLYGPGLRYRDDQHIRSCASRSDCGFRYAIVHRRQIVANSRTNRIDLRRFWSRFWHRLNPS